MLSGETLKEIYPNHFSEVKRRMVVVLEKDGKIRRDDWGVNTVIYHK